MMSNPLQMVFQNAKGFAIVNGGSVTFKTILVVMMSSSSTSALM